MESARAIEDASTGRTTHARGWAVRPATTSDAEALASLRGRSLGPSHGASRKGIEHESAWVAVDIETDEPIGQIGGYAVRFRRGADRWPGVVAVGALTAPEWRRRGVLTALSEAALAAWRASGAAVVLGLPNEKWGSRARALGWRPFGTLRWLHRPIRPERILARRSGLARLENARGLGRAWNWLWLAPPVTGVRIRRITATDPEIDGLAETTADPATISILHDAAWVERRYLRSPSKAYVVLGVYTDRLAGYVVYSIRRAGERAFGVVAELEVAPGRDDLARTLLAHAVDDARAGGADTIVALATPGGTLRRHLFRAGFVVPRRSFTVHRIVFRSEIIDGSWQLSGGDFDVV